MNDKKIAVFFDCDNINAEYIDDVFNELANIGEVIIRQAIKDWSSPHHRKHWKKELLEEHGIEPIQVFPYKAGKNTADLRIVRGVMEIMTSSVVDTIAIVSGDSDFIDLARTIKSKGFTAVGFGESSTKDPIRKSYSKFFELPVKVLNKKIDTKDPISLLKDAIENQKDENGFAYVSKIGSYLQNKNSSFIATNYGAKTWGCIIKKYDNYFEYTYADSKRSAMIVKINT
ncbi:NYN domain-containing protein [Aliarcobacter butzleri]|uniref:NYN domain-containing protein n=1 Tax=Aliarcobacter butzleri TaxID=28197 RepID=UPI003BAEA8E2